MHKYQPRIHLVRLKPHDDQQQQQTAQPAETLSDLQLTSDSVMTFVFSETTFTAVTAYQNQLVNVSTYRYMSFFHHCRAIAHDSETDEQRKEET